MILYPQILDQFSPYSNDQINKSSDNEATQYANVGVNKVIKSELPTNLNLRTFHPVELTRSNGPLIIHGKRWYFLLVCAKNGDDHKRSRAIMDDYKINDIARHMVVCFTPYSLPGSNKPFITKKGKQGRIYAFFDSYLEYYEYAQKFNLEDRAFFEIIFGELPQKPHFDIDIDVSEFNELYPTDNIDNVAELLRESVVVSCVDVLTENNVTVDIQRDILLYSSHGPDKRSFHIIINNKCHDGHKEAKAFYEAVMNKVR